MKSSQKGGIRSKTCWRAHGSEGSSAGKKKRKRKRGATLDPSGARVMLKNDEKGRKRWGGIPCEQRGESSSDSWK